jgi:hypothetical protein
MASGKLKKIKAMAMAAGLAAGCSEQPAAANRESAMQESKPESDGAARPLPYSHGRSFATLDEYLEHLRRYAGPVGQPWYRRVGGDRYELVTTRVPPGEPQVFTREELMRRYGFTR